ncbi:MAG: hypothetical protein AB7G47_19515 [Mycolicibacterium sp.]|uniref:hypothetical protein n=1 Tax=Mycolicibacterium sp. TaxID=2320850 RepID=UPI003D12B7D8
MTTTATLAPDAERRAALLMSRYTTLTESNPGFHYDWHMRACEGDAADADSVTAALVGGRGRFGDLRRLVSDDRTFQVWRLRLEHPLWWIGARARYMTSPLAQIVSELANDQRPGLFGFTRSHLGITGYPGAHWFSQAKVAIAPLSAQGRDKLAVALRRELLGRRLCMSTVAVDDLDVGVVFPESEIDTVFDGTDLTTAIGAAEAIHGAQWAAAFNTMLGDLDPITWVGLTEALVAEGDHDRR